jgi:hypothetical protein
VLPPHDGSVTTAKLDSGAKAPDAAKLDGASPSDSPNHALKLRDLSVQLTTAPGSGAGRTFGVSINAVVWTNGCFIDDTATTCTGSTALNVPANSTLSIAETAYFGTPADADARFVSREAAATALPRRRRGT